MPIDLVPQMTSAAVRAFGLGLIAFVGLWVFRIRSSAARHATWTVVLAGMLIQIPLEMVAPTVPLKALPALAAPLQPRAVNSARVFVWAARTLAPANRTPAEPAVGGVSSGSILAGLYLAISLLLSGRMALGSWGLHRILRGAKPVDSLGPDVFESDLLAVPGSVGWLRARILLPRTWNEWDAIKLRAVLAHERAHIRRRDWLIRVASHVNVCVFWFHPLAWWLERELARLAEDACDDVALSEVDDREDYAAILVEIARTAGADWGVISMATNSNVIGRVNRILNRRLQVPKPLGRFAWTTLVACSLPVIYLAAAVKLAPADPDPAALRRAVLPEQNSAVRAIAQAAPNQRRRSAPPVSRGEGPPITMCILLDNSGSMRNKREAVKAAASALMKASKPDDEVCIVDFNDDAYLDLDFTSDTAKMEDTLKHLDSRGGTAMRDAVRMALGHVEQKAHNDRKVLVLVTEGEDNASSVSMADLLTEIRRSDVLVYSIGMPSEDSPRQATRDKRALGQLAEASGGMDFYANDLAEVESISAELAKEIRGQ
jgi:Mg-chelatase subunit ChlD